ncbi:AbrB/MazE/SpoVT family DNA-binding domain-containing protein [Priestia aryabhattai]|uniref:AbrB/MazE/SpoVT family DNA-binding domain-containing protein n=1 Tax=Priestia aryabhattai TaxID=412384 RepID=UPI003B683EFE
MLKLLLLTYYFTVNNTVGIPSVYLVYKKSRFNNIGIANKGIKNEWWVHLKLIFIYEVHLKGFLLMKEDESLKEDLIIDNMGRVKIPPLFLKHANIQPSAAIQFLNYKNYFVMKQIEASPVFLKKKMKLNDLIRTIDHLGCIVIPKILREIHDMNLCEKIGVKLINESIIFYKKRKQNKSTSVLKESLKSELNKLSLLEIKEGKIRIPNFLLKSLDLEVNMQLQFFTKDQDTIVAKKHQYEFFTEENLFSTGQSRVVNKDKRLNIPKKIRDYLNINNGDILEVKIIGDTLVIKKAI